MHHGLNAEVGRAQVFGGLRTFRAAAPSRNKYIVFTEDPHIKPVLVHVTPYKHSIFHHWGELGSATVFCLCAIGEAGGAMSTIRQTKEESPFRC